MFQFFRVRAASVWIAVLYAVMGALRFLSPGDSPCAVFPLDEGEIISDVYASCNLHGLWKAGF